MSSLLNTITLGDARILSQHIPNDSIDLVFTDPPYLKEYIPLYGWLSKEANRVLKPGGFLLTYVGNYWKYETMLQLGQHMTYFWDYITYMSNESTIVWPRRTIARHKSILAFVKGQGLPRTNVLSAWVGSGKDKTWHVWGQDEGTARYYIDCFSSSGGTIWEPFCGGGTVPYVCKILGRNFIAFDQDPQAVADTIERLKIVQPLLMPEEVIQPELMGGVA